MNNHVMSASSLPDAEDGLLSKKMKLDDGSGNEMHDDDDVQGAHGNSNVYGVGSNHDIENPSPQKLVHEDLFNSINDSSDQKLDAAGLEILTQLLLRPEVLKHLVQALVEYPEFKATIDKMVQERVSKAFNQLQRTPVRQTAARGGTGGRASQASSSVRRDRRQAQTASSRKKKQTPNSRNQAYQNEGQDVDWPRRPQSKSAKRSRSGKRQNATAWELANAEGHDKDDALSQLSNEGDSGYKTDPESEYAKLREEINDIGHDPRRFQREVVKGKRYDAIFGSESFRDILNFEEKRRLYTRMRELTQEFKATDSFKNMDDEDKKLHYGHAQALLNRLRQKVNRAGRKRPRSSNASKSGDMLFDAI